MWALAAGSDCRKLEDEYRKAENERQAERIEEMEEIEDKKVKMVTLLSVLI